MNMQNILDKVVKAMFGNMVKVYPIIPIHKYVNGYVDSYERDIEININFDRDKLEILNTLSHEIVHVEQIIRGDLEMHKDHLIWKGEKVMFSHVIACQRKSTEAYRSLPWEAEAYKRQLDVFSLIAETILTKQDMEFLMS